MNEITYYPQQNFISSLIKNTYLIKAISLKLKLNMNEHSVRISIDGVII